ncbi:TPA: helix-turn-helix domain-containing protein, partial [Clostridioides difficile]
EEYNLSCTYLNTKFKSETGYTFNDFLNRYRMQKAVELLKSDQYKVYEIAEMVGFSDYKYFIKVFKKYIGCSPAKFMELGDGNKS